jgi:hypothetical protein
MNFTPKNQVMPTGQHYISKTDFFSDPDKEEVVAVHNMRFDGLVDAVKSLANEGFHGSKEMKLVAVFPPGLPEHCCKVWGITWAEFWSDQKWIKKMLNDPMFADFRVAPGRV